MIKAYKKYLKAFTIIIATIASFLAILNIPWIHLYIKLVFILIKYILPEIIVISLIITIIVFRNKIRFPVFRAKYRLLNFIASLCLIITFVLFLLSLFPLEFQRARLLKYKIGFEFLSDLEKKSKYKEAAYWSKKIIDFNFWEIHTDKFLRESQKCTNYYIIKSQFQKKFLNDVSTHPNLVILDLAISGNFLDPGNNLYSSTIDNIKNTWYKEKELLQQTNNDESSYSETIIQFSRENRFVHAFLHGNLFELENVLNWDKDNLKHLFKQQPREEFINKVTSAKLIESWFDKNRWNNPLQERSEIEKANYYVETLGFEKAKIKIEELYRMNQIYLNPSLLFYLLGNQFFQKDIEKMEKSYNISLSYSNYLEPEINSKRNKVSISLYWRGSNLLEHGKIDEAIQTLEQAYLLSPTNFMVIDMLAALYEKEKKYAKLIQLCEKAKSIYRNNVLLYYYLGGAYFNTGEKTKALETYNEAINSKSTSDYLFPIYATVGYITKEFNHAFNLCKELLENVPGDYQTYIDACNAGTYIISKMFDEFLENKTHSDFDTYLYKNNILTIANEILNWLNTAKSMANSQMISTDIEPRIKKLNEIINKIEN